MADNITITTPSRRAALAGGLALVAGTTANVAAIVGAKAAEQDPIYQAIANHRTPNEVLGANCSRLDEEGTPEAEAVLNGLYEAESEAWSELIDVEPTTIAGVVALLHYFVELEGCGDIGLRYFEDEDGRNRLWSYFVHSNLAAALEAVQS